MRLCTWYAGIDLDSRYLGATLGFSTNGQTPRIFGSKVFEIRSDHVRDRCSRPVSHDRLTEVGQWFHLETGGTLSEVAVALPGSMIQEWPSSGERRFDAPTVIDSSALEDAQRWARLRASQLGPVAGSAIRGYQVDGRPAPAPPVGSYATSLRVEITSWLVRPAMAQPVLDAVNEIGFTVSTIVPRAVAASESALTASERRDGATLVMIGDDVTECATCLDSTLADVFTVPLGRMALTAELARACKVSPEVIDRLNLRLMIDRAPSDPIVHSVRTVMSAWGTALFTLVRKRLQERDHAWRVQAGIVIANPVCSFPTLDERAARVLGMPARFTAMDDVFTRLNGTSRGSYAALGLVPLQSRSRPRTISPAEVRPREREAAPARDVREPVERGGFGQTIGRWLREFVPGDHYLS